MLVYRYRAKLRKKNGASILITFSSKHINAKWNEKEWELFCPLLYLPQDAHPSAVYCTSWPSFLEQFS